MVGGLGWDDMLHWWQLSHVLVQMVTRLSFCQAAVSDQERQLGLLFLPSTLHCGGHTHPWRAHLHTVHHHPHWYTALQGGVSYRDQGSF